MARPNKSGVDYFSLDKDFYHNKKVRKILRSCGPVAGTILTCLLCEIYGDKGYYIPADDLPFFISDIIPVGENEVEKVVEKAISVGFFSALIFEQHKILTSAEIQRRFKAITYKRSKTVIDTRYEVIDDGNAVMDVNNPVSDDRSTQSKVKESKVKKRESTETPHDLKKSNLFREPKIPKMEQVLEAFLNSGGSKEMAEKFFASNEATNWFYKGSPITNFSSLIPGYISAWKKNNKNQPEKKQEQPAPYYPHDEAAFVLQREAAKELSKQKTKT